MQFKIKMTPAQIETLNGWMLNDGGPDAAEVLIDQTGDRVTDRDDGSIYVGQGDDRATILVNGTITEED